MDKTGNKYFEQAMKELEYLSGDPDFKRIVEAREGFLRDLDGYKDAGREEGEKKKQKEIAKKMLAKNMPIEDITELTGLTKEEVENLKKEK